MYIKFYVLHKFCNYYIKVNDENTKDKMIINESVGGKEVFYEFIDGTS